MSHGGTTAGKGHATKGRPTESRVLRAVATVDRLERARPDEWTGEISRPWQLDELSGLRVRPDEPARLDRRPPPKPPRLRGPRELALRLGAVLLLLGTLSAFFGEAARLTVGRVFGGRAEQPWREVQLTIDSDPAGAIVFVQGTARGRTPLTTADYCRGRVIRLRLAAAGYSNWTWDGFCPADGALVLRARLQALPGGVAPSTAPASGKATSAGP